MEKHWVTGASGFIGRHLCSYLVTQGHVVTGLGRGGWSDAEAAECGLSRWLSGDISASNLSSLGSVSGVPDVVFHLAGGASVGAALENPHADFLSSVAASAELLEWLRQESPQTRLVVASSAAVYGAGHLGPIPETAVLRPCSPYGYHKLMMESLCRSYAISYASKVVVARLFSVYGAGLRKQLMWDLCRKLEAGVARVELGGSGNELRDWTDVRDIVCALTSVSKLASAEMPIVNVGAGKASSVRDIAEGILEAWGAGARNREVVFDGRARAGDPFSLQADAQKMEALGFEWKIPITQGLADYVRWFASRNQLV